MTRRELLSHSVAIGAVALPRSGAASAGGISLVEAGRAALIVSGPEDLSSARYFAKAIEEFTGVRMAVTTSEPEAGNRPVIRIGNAGNAAIRALLGSERAGRLTSQGIAIRTVAEGSRPVLVIAGGSPAATPGACGEVLNYRLDAGPNRAAIAQVDLVDNPALPYRIFWNWDHSTNWNRGVAGEQEEGCVNPYAKKRTAFLNDFRVLLDFMGEHKINGLILWGFLRDSHGGVEDGRALTEYADSRGVRVLPGIGTSFYGGFFYEGRHPFNMDTWLADKPSSYQLLGEKRLLLDGHTGLERMRNALCPSQPENREWLRRGAEWMFTEFPKLNGFNLENGDFFTCQCDACKHARSQPDVDPNFYFDMAATQLPIIEVAREKRSDAWMTYATYTGFSADEIWKHTDKSLIRAAVPRFVSQYPEQAVCQWTFTSMVKGWGDEPEAVVRKRWPSGLRPPTKHSIGLLHQGSQWYRSAKEWWSHFPRGNDTGQRYVDISELIRYTSERCAQEGLEGIEILGEVSDA